MKHISPFLMSFLFSFWEHALIQYECIVLLSATSTSSLCMLLLQSLQKPKLSHQVVQMFLPKVNTWWCPFLLQKSMKHDSFSFDHTQYALCKDLEQRIKPTGYSSTVTSCRSRLLYCIIPGLCNCPIYKTQKAVRFYILWRFGLALETII